MIRAAQPAHGPGRVRLAPELRAELVARAAASGAEECCGLCLGTEMSARFEVHELYASANVAPERRAHFALDPLVLLHGEAHARARGLELLGTFHSHPRSAARPSQLDLAGQPGWLQLIVGFPPDRPVEVRAWRHAHGRPFELALCE